jgi:hypothetical protein
VCLPWFSLGVVGFRCLLGFVGFQLVIRRCRVSAVSRLSSVIFLCYFSGLRAGVGGCCRFLWVLGVCVVGVSSCSCSSLLVWFCVSLCCCGLFSLSLINSRGVGWLGIFFICLFYICCYSGPWCACSLNILATAGAWETSTSWWWRFKESPLSRHDHAKP